MRPLAHPQHWFPLALILLAVVGAALLLTPQCVDLSPRDRTAYGLRPMWQAGFDALSAACGAGLLTFDLDDQYTPAGRWVLAGIGVLGALAYLLAARQIFARCMGDVQREMPGWLTLFATLAVLQVAAVGVAGALDRTAGLNSAAWRAVASFCSLGWLDTPPADARNTLYAAIALVGGLGWPVWLIWVPAWRRSIHVRRLAAVLGGYLVWLLLLALLVGMLETPRLQSRRQAPTPILGGADPPARFCRSLVLVTAGATAGQATESTERGYISEGTKVGLAAAVLVGGLGGSPSGGVHFPLLLLAATWVLATVRNPERAITVPPGLRPAALASVVSLLAAAIVTALGVLLIESWTASGYQTAPSFADALLDASSAVGGAGLTTGLTARVTGANLSSGMRQSVDAYQYGMTWLMVAMLIGRALPVVILARAAASHPGPPPSELPPI